MTGSKKASSLVLEQVSCQSRAAGSLVVQLPDSMVPKLITMHVGCSPRQARAGG